MRTDKASVVPCIGCMYLTKPDGLGHGFMCTHPKCRQIDYVTGYLGPRRAQAARKEGACGPSALLRKVREEHE